MKLKKRIILNKTEKETEFVIQKINVPCPSSTLTSNKKSSKFSRHIVHLNFFDYSLLDWKKSSWYLIKNRYKLKLLFFLSYDNFLSLNLTRMIVLLVGLIHAIHMYLVLSFKLYKKQTSFYHIYCACCVLVGLPFISILSLIIQNEVRSYIKTISDLLRHKS